MHDYKKIWLVVVGTLCTVYLLLFDNLNINSIDQINLNFNFNQRNSLLLKENRQFNVSRWIVVTSINKPTEDLKRLSSQPGWSVVVVADKKTPPDWQLPGVHFLSVEKQLNLGLKLPSLLPFKTYTRKNAGYLYAIMNGAEWIYDTDDDNKPYGRGLEQFDFGATVSGLRYRPLTPNASISERLFNPYSFFGSGDMWPRGFPLEYLKEHTNGHDRYLLCREMRPAAVQQGIVHKDPDVDAVYRLLHANPTTGLNERFNQFAPPILLDSGTYAPWNSQNTLIHRNAFFTMFLPTSVEFRVTDIWRSFFSQKLLHLIGESIAFYPVNAIQIRNAHDYLADFQDEKAVYLKSGRIVEFLNEWECTKNTTKECTIALAAAFGEEGFMGERDVGFIEVWIDDLESIGYTFPPLVKNATGYTQMKENSRQGNCRRANLNLVTDLTTNYTEPQLARAEQKINDFEELLEWCQKSNGSTLPDSLLLPPHKLARKHSKMTSLRSKLNSVLVITNNWPWTHSIGLLQRLYQSYFGVIVFCGTWNPDKYTYNETVPNMRAGFNYVHLTEKEMFKGYFAYYCMSKVRDLRLQNVKGYYFLSDDAIFNIWVRNDMDSVTHPRGILNGIKPFWWNTQYGFQAAKRIVDLVNKKYAKDNKIQRLWREFDDRLTANNYTNVKEHMLTFNGKTPSDFYYVPSGEFDFFSDLSELFMEGSLFLENAVNKMLFAAKRLKTAPHLYLWSGADRTVWDKKYNSTRIMMHPLKFSPFSKDRNQANRFCSSVVSTYKKELYE